MFKTSSFLRFFLDISQLSFLHSAPLRFALRRASAWGRPALVHKELSFWSLTKSTKSKSVTVTQKELWSSEHFWTLILKFLKKKRGNFRKWLQNLQIKKNEERKSKGVTALNSPHTVLTLRSLESLVAFFHAVSQCELSWIVFWSSSERPAAHSYAPIDLTGIPWYRMDSYGSSLTAHYATNPSSFEIQKWKHMISSSPSHLLFFKPHG